MMKKINVLDIVKHDDIISGMMGYWQIVAVLTNLQKVLDQNIEGDIVELGCYIGTTTMYIQKLLNAYGSNKKIHVYDSWQGLPNLTQYERENAKSINGFKFQKGSCRTQKEHFVNTFVSRNLKLPIIHSGWFADIPDIEYPEKICFAFFDGDFYTSIMDSFNKTFHKVQKGGIIMIDDCGWDVLPGCEKACLDFLADKKETLDKTGYPDGNGIYGGFNGGGLIIKL